MKNKIYRSRDNRILLGVCSSLSHILKIDVSIIRLIFIILSFLSYLTVLFYILAIIIIPEETDEQIYKKVISSKNKRAYRMLLILIMLVLLLFSFLNIPMFVFIPKIPLIYSLIFQSILVSIFLFIYFYYFDDHIFFRDQNDKLVSGIFSSLAKMAKVDVVIFRLFYLGFILLFFSSPIVLVFSYIIVSFLTTYPNDNLD
jgi:phage shock protein C